MSRLITVWFFKQAPLEPNAPSAYTLIALTVSSSVLVWDRAERNVHVFVHQKTLYTHVFSIYPTSAYHESVELNLFELLHHPRLSDQRQNNSAWSLNKCFLMHVISKWRNFDFTKSTALSINIPLGWPFTSNIFPPKVFVAAVILALSRAI